MGDSTITRVLVKVSGVSCLAFRTTTLSCGVLFLGGSAPDMHRCFIVAGLARMGTRSECHGNTFHSPENISRMYRSMKGVLRSKLAANYSTIPN